MTGLPWRLANQPLLDQRHLLEGQLDAEVAAGHHHRVGSAEDALQVVERRRLFDLGHELHRRRHQAAQLRHVLGAAHE